MYTWVKQTEPVKFVKRTYLGPYPTPSGVLGLARANVPVWCGCEAALLVWRKESSFVTPARVEKSVRRERVPLWLWIPALTLSR